MSNALKAAFLALLNSIVLLANQISTCMTENALNLVPNFLSDCSPLICPRRACKNVRPLTSGSREQGNVKMCVQKRTIVMMRPVLVNRVRLAADTVLWITVVVVWMDTFMYKLSAYVHRCVTVHIITFSTDSVHNLA